MNEIFKELSLQAGGSHYPTINPQMQQKFAELIVLEMCKELDKAQWDKGEDWVCADGTRIIPQIKQHFGIEK